MRVIRIWRYLIVGLLFLAACASQPTSETNTPEATISPTQTSTLSEATPYPYPYPPPLPTQDLEAEPYPPPTIDLSGDAYPEPLQTETVTGGPPFQLEKPIREGTTLVTGVGPANVPIVILDVTFMGELIGEGVIDSEGTFSIEVEALEKGHRIGVTLGNLEDTEWTEESFYGAGFNGDEALLVPQVGFMYDTAIVVEE